MSRTVDLKRLADGLCCDTLVASRKENRVLDSRTLETQNQRLQPYLSRCRRSRACAVIQCSKCTTRVTPRTRSYGYTKPRASPKGQRLSIWKDHSWQARPLIYVQTPSIISVYCRRCIKHTNQGPRVKMIFQLRPPMVPVSSLVS